MSCGLDKVAHSYSFSAQNAPLFEHPKKANLHEYKACIFCLLSNYLDSFWAGVMCRWRFWWGEMHALPIRSNAVQVLTQLQPVHFKDVQKYKCIRTYQCWRATRCAGWEKGQIIWSAVGGCLCLLLVDWYSPNLQSTHMPIIVREVNAMMALALAITSPATLTLCVSHLCIKDA